MIEDREKLIKDLINTLLTLGVTWNPRTVARELIDLGYRKAAKTERLGHWDYYSTTMMECSVCKKHVPKHRYKFCPECGSKMVPKVKATLDSKEDWEQLDLFNTYTGEN
jgi:DNA-directed RNA polymerase subunit RPC12/RpoP